MLAASHTHRLQLVPSRKSGCVDVGEMNVICVAGALNNSRCDGPQLQGGHDKASFTPCSFINKWCLSPRENKGQQSSRPGFGVTGLHIP